MQQLVLHWPGSQRRCQALTSRGVRSCWRHMPRSPAPGRHVSATRISLVCTARQRASVSPSLLGVGWRATSAAAIVGSRHLELWCAVAVVCRRSRFLVPRSRHGGLFGLLCCSWCAICRARAFPFLLGVQCVGAGLVGEPSAVRASGAAPCACVVAASRPACCAVLPRASPARGPPVAPFCRLCVVGVRAAWTRFCLVTRTRAVRAFASVAAARGCGAPRLPPSRHQCAAVICQAARTVIAAGRLRCCALPALQGWSRRRVSRLV